ncbi:LysR family transcriptional regulator [Shigella flexneri]|nr:LysR family transcriptional regulator [Shigella flexneri]
MANLYDLKKFDLNLLVIFECIYQHLSISKAAESLYITPSAVSQSLQRLRAQFNDPLFIRSGKGIAPTTTGLNLHHHLEKNLKGLEQTINIVNKSELKKNFIGNDSNLLIVFYVQIMPDDLVMQLHRF